MSKENGISKKESVHLPHLAIQFRTNNPVSIHNGVLFVGKNAVPDFFPILSKFGRNRVSPLYQSLTPKISSANRKMQKKNPETPNLESFVTVDFFESIDEYSVIEAVTKIPQVRSAHFVHFQFPTTNYQEKQKYLDPVPDGHDIKFGWDYPGGAGQGIQICVIEGSFNVEHEDIPNVNVVYPVNGIFPHVPVDPYPVGMEHGTNTMGVLGALPNGFGVTGICNKAKLLFASAYTVQEDRYIADTWNAIIYAAEALNRGDILLLELGSRGESEIREAFFPIEYHSYLHTLIQSVVFNEIIVIEPAGNGNIDLGATPNEDGKYIWNPEHEDFNDSGAIVVGGGVSTMPDYQTTRPPNAKGANSNYNSKHSIITAVPPHCRSWSNVVATCSLGQEGGVYLDIDAHAGKNNSYVYYTGTSAASAVITGLAGIIQGIVNRIPRRERLTPKEMRILLRDPENGVPQVDGPDAESWQQHRVGPLPVVSRLARALEICPDEETICYAPFFRPGTRAELIILFLSFLSIYPVLSFRAQFSSAARCQLKRWKYRLRNFFQGNTECVRLQ
jgi:hypothetical protein